MILLSHIIIAKIRQKVKPVSVNCDKLYHIQLLKTYFFCLMVHLCRFTDSCLNSKGNYDIVIQIASYGLAKSILSFKAIRKVE